MIRWDPMLVGVRGEAIQFTSGRLKSPTKSRQQGVGQEETTSSTDTQKRSQTDAGCCGGMYVPPTTKEDDELSIDRNTDSTSVTEV